MAEVKTSTAPFIVAVDGPAGTGKSSVTKRLADLLGLIHIDTGALYRGIAFLCAEEEIPLQWSPAEEKRIIEIAKFVKLEFRRNPKRNPANRLYVNGKDVTPFIRTPEMSMMASKVSAIPAVREALLELQRTLGKTAPSILEGRDIGTVVFPDATLKFFLTASIDERAKRRLAELEAAGADTPSYEELREQMRLRDEGDMTRAIAPLKKAPDAVELDTTQFTLDQVVQKMSKVIGEKMTACEMAAK